MEACLDILFASRRRAWDSWIDHGTSSLHVSFYNKHTQIRQANRNGRTVDRGASCSSLSEFLRSQRGQAARQKRGTHATQNVLRERPSRITRGTRLSLAPSSSPPEPFSPPCAQSPTSSPQGSPAGTASTRAPTTATLPHEQAQHRDCTNMAAPATAPPGKSNPTHSRFPLACPTTLPVSPFADPHLCTPARIPPSATHSHVSSDIFTLLRE